MNRPNTARRALTLSARAARALALALPVCLCAGHAGFAASSEKGMASTPPQIPLCMIGDSITWADHGDTWRQFLLEQIPTLAFVGTHTAKLGYSHAGEGGNSTAKVLARIDAIPDCRYYHLHIGTNDNNTKDPARVERAAAGTAERIIAIVNALLKKPSVEKVFLASVFPCHTDNPLRDQTNARTNVFLRERLATAFPPGKVVWVEYEKPIRETENWEPLIRLHPTPEGYRLVARILADALRETLNLPAALSAPRPRSGAGVRVVNLWRGGSDGQTIEPVIAGWYTLSFDVVSADPAGGTVTIRNTTEVDKRLRHATTIKPADAGKRIAINFFTGYEGYGYARTPLSLDVQGCRIDRILLEKQRPSGKASRYGVGSYLDTESPFSAGELLELP